mmetsp:Transcript_66756/g.206755  ORF Transcript_66756/g.206755 Transcript_66756/m.206755 type:complete len:207 (-) Transcript_66756:656-1276(-)
MDLRREREAATSYGRDLPSRTCTVSERSLPVSSSSTPTLLGRPSSRSAHFVPAGALSSMANSLGIAWLRAKMGGPLRGPRQKQAEAAMALAPRRAAMPPAQSMVEEPAWPWRNCAAEGSAAASLSGVARPPCCQRERCSQPCGTPGPWRKRMVGCPSMPPGTTEETSAVSAAPPVPAVSVPQSASTSTGAALLFPCRKGPRQAAAL